MNACLIFLTLLQVAVSAQQSSVPGTDANGNLSAGHVYYNPVLGIIITLPGTWQFLQVDPSAAERQKMQASQCTGAFCYRDINVVLTARLDQSSHIRTLILLGYKLQPPYLDRDRYPLKDLAETITRNTQLFAGVSPSGELTPIQLQRRPAYRLMLLGHSDVGNIRAVAYVSESNDHVFVLIAREEGVMSGVAELAELQAALEKTEFSSAAPELTAVLDAPRVSDAALARQGRIVNERIYENSLLGIRVNLPGTWQFLEQAPDEAPCDRALCDAINVALSTKVGERPIHTFFLLAYKLKPPYFDRSRYPLRKLAESLALGNIKGSGWFTTGDLTQISLQGRPAYRLIVHKSYPPKMEPVGFAYVTESNGYIFMLLGTEQPTPAAGATSEMQSAIETMQLTGSVNPN